MAVQAPQKQVFSLDPLLVLAMVGMLSLAACVNLSPPWDGVRGQGGAAADTSGAGGAPDFSDVASGGTAGAASSEVDASGSGGAGTVDSLDAARDADAATRETQDLFAGGGGETSSGGTQVLPGATGGTVSPGGAGGRTQLPDSSSGGSAGGASGGTDASTADDHRDVQADQETDAPVGDNGDASDVASDLVDAVETSALDVVAPEVGDDLALNPDTADAPPVCNSAYFDAKAMGHTNGWAESDGWYLSGSGQFVYENNVTYLAVKTKITVVARGDLSSNQWPTIEASAGRTNIVGTATVSSSVMTAYSFTFDALTSYAGVGVTVTSGSGLHIQSVTIDCP